MLDARIYSKPREHVTSDKNMMNRVCVQDLDGTNHKPREARGVEGQPKVLQAESRERVGEVREEHGSGGRGGGVEDGERFEVDNVVCDEAVRNTPTGGGVDRGRGNGGEGPQDGFHDKFLVGVGRRDRS